MKGPRLPDVLAHLRLDLAISCLALSFLTGSAETPKSPGVGQSKTEYVFSSTVRRVPVDVVVLDQDGNPVLGLKKDDFVVQEDGKRQKVLSFDVFDGRSPSFVPPKMPDLPPNTFVDLPREPERGPLYVLYFDMVNMSQDDQMSFRRELLKFIDQAPPGTRIALFVNAKGLHLLQGFTTDHALLRAAILRKGPPPSVPDVFLYGENYGRYDAGAALSNLNFISEFLSGLPDRKNLIWLASYFPIPVGPTLTVLDTTRPSSAPPSGAIGGNGGPTTLDLSELLAESVKQTYASMMRSRVALYPVSVSGVTADLVSQDQMDMMAAATGGHAYYGNNHTSELIEHAVEHGESYYTLSYSPQNNKYDGAERHISVALADKSKNYTLTYRTGYYAVSDVQAQEAHRKEQSQKQFLAAKARDTLFATVEHGAPMMHEVLFVARLRTEGEPRPATSEEMQSLEESPAYFRTRKHNKNTGRMTPVKLQKYVIDYDVLDPQLRVLAAAKQKPTVLEFAAAAYDNDGTLLNSILNGGVLSNEKPTDGNGDHKFHATQQLQVPPGAAYIRLVVRNTLNDRTGALELKLPLQTQAETVSVKPGI